MMDVPAHWQNGICLFPRVTVQSPACECSAVCSVPLVFKPKLRIKPEVSTQQLSCWLRRLGRKLEKYLLMNSIRAEMQKVYRGMRKRMLTQSGSGVAMGWAVTSGVWLRVERLVFTPYPVVTRESKHYCSLTSKKSCH